MVAEREWVSKLVPRLELAIQGESGDGRTVRVSSGKKLPYRYEVMKFKGKGPDKEGTSVSRYETDLLVYDALDQDVWIPRVVIECKLEAVTTHDAITYSRKASTHKQVHPYLRYGILIGSWGDYRFPARLFRHGEHFDFMAIWAGTEPTDAELKDFTAVLSDEIKSSRKIHEILTSGRSPAKTRYTLVHRPLRVR